LIKFTYRISKLMLLSTCRTCNSIPSEPSWPLVKVLQQAKAHSRPSWYTVLQLKKRKQRQPQIIVYYSRISQQILKFILIRVWLIKTSCNNIYIYMHTIWIITIYPMKRFSYYTKMHLVVVHEMWTKLAFKVLFLRFLNFSNNHFYYTLSSFNFFILLLMKSTVCTWNVE